MNRFGLTLFFLLLYVGCGVKGPPLPPMKSQDQVKEDKSDLIEKDNKKKKKKINAPFQF